MRSISRLLLGGVAALGAAACAKTQEKAAQPRRQYPASNQLLGTGDWRARMQMNHNADSSIEHQVRRLTSSLDLTPSQQAKVRQLSRWHNDRIQTTLDTAPSALTYDDFQTQVHAISTQYHDSVNAILTLRQLGLMKAMVGRLDSGGARRPAR